MDFETLLREDPDHVIEYLANRGTKLLGTFITEVRVSGSRVCLRAAACAGMHTSSH